MGLVSLLDEYARTDQDALHAGLGLATLAAFPVFFGTEESELREKVPLQIRLGFSNASSLHSQARDQRGSSNSAEMY
jgi:hypothetical protein